MKRKCTEGSTKGSKKPAKTTKKMAYESDDDDDDFRPSSPKGNMAIQSKRLTRSQAATIQKCPIQIPDIALKPEKGTKGAASKSSKLISARRFVEKNDGVCTSRGKKPTEEKGTGATCISPKLTCARRFVEKNDIVLTNRGKHPTEEIGIKNKGATSKSPKLTCARRFVEQSDGVSTNRGKQPTEEFTDETAHHENQDTYPFMASASPSSNELLQRILSSAFAKEKSDAQEAHSYQLTEMAAMMNRGRLDAGVELDKRINPTIPSSAELVQNNLAPNVAEEVNKAQKALSICFTEMAAMMCHGPSDYEEDADSSLSFIDVEGYLVKKDIAPLLKKIIDKYKNIAKDCIIMKKESHVPILEMICLSCQKLGETSFKDVNDDGLNGILLAVESFQNMGFDVKWLTERLKDISKLKRLINLRPVIKEADSKLDLQKEKIQMFKQQIGILKQQTDMLMQQTDMLKQQLSTEEADFLAKKMEHDKARYDFNQDMEDLTPKGFQHWSNDLLYGLI